MMSDLKLSAKLIETLIVWYGERIKWWYVRWGGAHEARQKAFLAIPHSENPHELAQQVSDLDDEIKVCEYAFSVLSDELDFVESLKKRRNF